MTTAADWLAGTRGELQREFQAIWDRETDTHAEHAYAADEAERQAFADTLRQGAVSSFAKRIEFQQYVEAAPDAKVTRRELMEILTAAGVL